VQSLLSQYGTVTSVKVLDTSAHSDKAAMVRMGSVEEATWLKNNLDGNIPQGLSAVIQVKFAQAKQEKGGYGPAEKGKGKGKGGAPYGKGAPAHVAPPNQPKNRLQISGLAADTTQDSLKSVIGQYGNVKDVQITGGGSASITFEDAETAQWFLDNLNGNIPQGLTSPITVTQGSGAAAPASGASMTGTVKHWNEERGMGFVAPADGSADCFVHRSFLVEGTSLTAGSQVSFQAEWDYQKNKPTAKQVRAL